MFPILLLLGNTVTHTPVLHSYLWSLPDMIMSNTTSKPACHTMTGEKNKLKNADVMNKMHMVQSWLEAQITPITSRNKIQHSLINVSLCRSLRHYVTPTMSAYTSKTL